MQPASWSPDLSSSYCSDINMLLIDYAWCKLCNKWLLLSENNPRSLTLDEKHYCCYYSKQGDNGNLKRQIKSGILCTSRLFLLT